MNKKFYIAVLIIVFCIYAGVRLIKIGSPDRPVFDESQFITYALRYANHLPYIGDIHPPLGKIIYAIPAVLSGQNTSDIDMTSRLSDEDNPADPKLGGYQDFKNVPYRPMRLIGILISLGLGAGIYFFVKTVSGDGLAAMIALLLVAFENYLALENRFVLLNHPYLALGFVFLWLVLRSKPKIFWGGIVLGLALSVKLSAIVFIGPVLWSMLGPVKPISQTQFKQIVITGLSVLALFFFIIHNLIIPPETQISYFKQVLPKSLITVNPNAAVIIKNNPLLKTGAEWLTVSVINGSISLSGYVYHNDDKKNHIGPTPSKWFEWPLMKNVIPYDSDTRNGKIIYPLISVGNPIIWFGAFMAVAGTIAGCLYRYFKKIDLLNIREERAQKIFLSGYVFSLVPFLFVHRVTYLYHYLPALLFGICLLAIYLKKMITDTRLLVKTLGIIYLIMVIPGFIIASPYTYGFSWPLSETILKFLKILP